MATERKSLSARSVAILKQIARVFQRIGRGQLAGTTVVISLVKVLTKPPVNADEQLAATYRDLLLGSENFQTVDIGPPVAQLAADLRARYGPRTPDAMQIAVALIEGCEAFLTNDSQLGRVAELPILLVDELEL